MTLTTTNNDSFTEMLADIEQMQKQCKALLQTKHYAAMGEAGIFAILQKAKSLGINPISALNGGLYYVSGKVGMSTEMMATLIRRAGHSIVKDPKSDGSICILHGRRADNGDTWTCSFSIDDAKRAGLYKNMYEKYPQIMTYNRCCSMLARQLFPDIIDGCGYTLDELNEIKESKSSGFTQPPAFLPAADVTVEPIVIERISVEKASELVEILDGCDPAFKKHVLDTIKMPPHNASNLFELPVILYDKLLKGALKKRDEWKLKNVVRDPQTVETQPES